MIVTSGDTALDITTASSSDGVSPPATKPDSDQTYPLLNLKSMGKLFIPQTGIFDLEYLMSREIDDFFYWYSS